MAEAATKTDSVIDHLWQRGKEFPDGTVTFPQAISHPFPVSLRQNRRALNDHGKSYFPCGTRMCHWPGAMLPIR